MGRGLSAFNGPSVCACVLCSVCVSAINLNKERSGFIPSTEQDKTSICRNYIELCLRPWNLTCDQFRNLNLAETYQSTKPCLFIIAKMSMNPLISEAYLDKMKQTKAAMNFNFHREELQINFCCVSFLFFLFFWQFNSTCNFTFVH